MVRLFEGTPVSEPEGKLAERAFDRAQIRASKSVFPVPLPPPLKVGERPSLCRKASLTTSSEEGTCSVHSWPFGKIDGPGKRNKP